MYNHKLAEYKSKITKIPMMKLQKFTVTALVIASLMLCLCQACTPGTEKKLIGCWEGENYANEDLTMDLSSELDLELPDDIHQYKYLKFTEDSYNEYTVINYNGRVLGTAQISGTWSTYKDKGIRVEYDLSTLEVKRVYEELGTKFFSVIYKNLMTNYGIDNDAIEGKISDEYNIAIRSISGEEPGATMIIDTDFSPVKYEKIPEGQYAADMVRMLTGKFNSNKSLADE